MPFKIKILSKTQELPQELVPWKEQLIFRCNLEFQDFHSEFLTVDGLLFLTDRKKNSAYYSTKLTSSVNYCKAYSLPCLIDTALQSIYSLPGAFVHEDQDDIVDAFHRMLHAWYRRQPLTLEVDSLSSTPEFGDEIQPIVIHHLLQLQLQTKFYKIVDIQYSTINDDHHGGDDNHDNHDDVMWGMTHISGGISTMNAYRIYPILLLSTIYQPVRHPWVENRILVILHHKNNNNKKPIPSFMDTISCYEPWDTIVDKIFSYQAVLSTSLHGLVCADAYNKPNLWLQEETENPTAFHDYFKTQQRPAHNISSLNDYHESLLYHGGNKINLDALRASFPL
jgi:hypothetical protein